MFSYVTADSEATAQDFHIHGVRGVLGSRRRAESQPANDGIDSTVWFSADSPSLCVFTFPSGEIWRLVQILCHHGASELRRCLKGDLSEFSRPDAPVRTLTRTETAGPGSAEVQSLQLPRPS